MSKNRLGSLLYGLLPLMLFFFLASHSLAQEKTLKPNQLVLEAQQKGVEFKAVNLLSPTSQTTAAMRESLSADLTDYSLFDASPMALQQTKRGLGDSKTISFNVGNTTLELVKVELFTPDFTVVTSSGVVPEIDLGVHYRGIIKGQPNSIAALSLYDNDIVAMFSSEQEGNMTLGKLGETDSYVLYRDLDHRNPPEFDCSTDDDVENYIPEDSGVNPQVMLPLSEACVRFYYEVDEDIHDDKGGVQGAINYVTALSNEVQTLYANESINTVISEIFVWENNSPYSGSVSQMRTQFQNRTSSINGDLGQLLTYKGSGGIAAGFNGICPSNVDESLSVSSISSSFSPVPIYTFTVMVVTHEFGHTFGSRHTHACVWNGNNTAIDGCYTTEGFCSSPGIPSSGGTIMSYCHLQSVGINFNNGFGPQPGDLIRSRVVNGACLGTCDGGNPTPTCSDGVQNGNETGVDCGGPDCAPCSSACEDNEVTLSITLDNYPEETSWTITNDSGQTVASGGTYGSQPDGSTVVENLCLVDDCYTFTINDSYGDGICCAYGSGSYTLTGPGGQLAAGGSFGSTESTDFCLGGGSGGDTQAPTAPTNLSASGTTQTTTQLSWNASSDNVGVTGYEVFSNGSSIGTVTGTSANITGLTASTTYQFFVQAFDAAGNQSGSSNTVSVTTLSNGGGGDVVLNEGFFETGLDGWTDGGSDCARVSSSRSYEGSYSIRIRDNSGTASSMTLSNVDLTPFNGVEVQFFFYPNSMETGEDFWLRFYNGSSWTTVASYASGSSFTNNSFYTATVTLSAADYNFAANSGFRFQCDASGNADRVYIDQVTITGLSSSNLPSGNTIEQIYSAGIIDSPIEVIEEEKDFVVYPNPTRGVLNVEVLSEEAEVTYRILNTMGKVVQDGSLEEDFVDVSRLASGAYFITVIDGEEVRTTKFIKY